MIRVDDRVRVALSELTEAEWGAVCRLATHANPNFGKPRHAGEPEFFRTWQSEGEHLTVPRGLLEGVLRALGGGGRAPEPGQEELAGIGGGTSRCSLSDGRTWRHPEELPEHRLALRSYQEEMVGAMLAHDDGIYRAPTGSGKTTCGFAAVARAKRRALVMVSDSALLKQWRERAVEELGIAPEDVGHIQGDREAVAPLTLGMQKTLANRFARGAGELAEAFDYLLCDEVQSFAAPTFQAAVGPFRARKRQGISADETRHDQLEFLIYDLFGPVRCATARERVLASGAVVEVEVAVVPTRFAAPWYRFRTDFVRLVREMSEDEARNALILSLVRSAVKSGEQVMVFTHRVEHARLLDLMVARAGIPGGLMLGGPENAAEFDRTKMRVKRGELRVATGTYKAIARGIDVPAVARGVACTPMHNNRQELNQVMGRLCRSADGKTHGRLAYLADEQVYGRKAARNFAEWCRRAVVWSGGRWVPAREYLAAPRAA